MPPFFRLVILGLCASAGCKNSSISSNSKNNDTPGDDIAPPSTLPGWFVQASTTQQGQTNGPHAVVGINEEIAYFAGKDGEIKITVDGGQTASALDTGVDDDLHGLAFANKFKAYAVGSNGVFLKTTDAGETWQHRYLTAANGINYASRLNDVVAMGDHVWTAGATGRILYSTNSGDTFEEATGTDDIFDSFLTFTGLAFTDELHGWAIGWRFNNGVIIGTTDGGKTWSVQKTVSDYLYGITTPGYGSKKAWAVGANGTLLTTIDGEEWTTVSFPFRTWLYAVQFITSQRGWVVGDEGKIYATFDGGTSWKAQQSPTKSILESISMVTADGGWVVGSDSSGSLGVVIRTFTGGEEMSSVVYPAPHPQNPEVESRDGPVLSNPIVMPIFFSGNPYKTAIHAMLNTTEFNSYWAETTAEYGVESLTVADSPTDLTDTLLTTVGPTEIKALLTAKLINGDFGTPDPNTVYMLFLPQGTTLAMEGFKSCATLGGFHSELALNGVAIPYAVIAYCDTGYRTFKGLDFFTLVTTHELIEAATDPFLSTNPAYRSLGRDHFAWHLALFDETEPTYLCMPVAQSIKLSGTNYTVSRSWSNKAQREGKDPCVPAQSAAPYFNTAIVEPDIMIVQLPSGDYAMRGLEIPVGGTKRIFLDAFSLEKVKPWTITGITGAEFLNLPPNLSFVFSKTTVNNGDKIAVDITVLEAGPNNLEGFAIVSTLGDQATYWASLVSSQ